MGIAHTINQRAKPPLILGAFGIGLLQDSSYHHDIQRRYTASGTPVLRPQCVSSGTLLHERFPHHIDYSRQATTVAVEIGSRSALVQTSQPDRHYATKLCEDKIAEGADHAVLSLLKFPAETRQLEIRDGAILANPARVAVIAEILRDSIVRSHCLRLSNQEREKKKGELYAYITGERFRQHMDSIESHTDRLLDIDVAEEKAHRKVWETRGTVVKTLRKAEGNLRADVARIIGTRDAAE